MIRITAPEPHAAVALAQRPAGAARKNRKDINDGANLLVMGARGHRRFVERLLGGATRTLVDRMTTPVLFAH